MVDSPSVNLLTREEIQAVLRENFFEFSQRFHVKRLGIFGSYVRDEQNGGSDVDILVEFDDDCVTLLEFVEFKNYLGDLLGIPVDLVEEETLKPEIGQKILQEVVRL